MMRFCPRCLTERPLSETVCEGQHSGEPCRFELSGEPPRPPGWRPAPPVVVSACPNGHPVIAGDVSCLVCGEPVAAAVAEASTGPTVIDGWKLGKPLPSTSKVRERFLTTHVEKGRQAVLTLYWEGAEPDPLVYDVLRSMPRDHVPEIIATGRWHERAYEVAEEVTGGTLADLGYLASDTDTLRHIAEEIGRALHSFTQAGLRHRDIRPANILVRRREPLDLVVIGFGSARLSELDLDVVSPLETTRYTAPEAVSGGVAAASDWWSLGIMLLEQVTRGACFEGQGDQAFLIRVLASGITPPAGIDPSIDTLLRGLLARDRRRRWQWKEVRQWLMGEPVEAPEAAEPETDAETGPGLTLGGNLHRKASSYALAASHAENWEKARDQFLRGELAAWIEEARFGEPLVEGLRRVGGIEDLSGDLKLALALKMLHPDMPLVVRGDIVTPGWLQARPAQGHELISGAAPDVLHDIGAEPWLSRLKARAEVVRKRAEQLRIPLDEDQLRVHLLSTSRAGLAAQWEDRRSLTPDTEHPGLATLMERRPTSEEDFILLLGTAMAQFRTADAVIDEAAALAERAGIAGFSREEAHKALGLPRRSLHRLVDERTGGFARCGNDRVDEWTDQYRLDRRIPLARALALLAVPASEWKEPPKQVYVSTLLDFFAKRISGAVLRGPLARMTVGRMTPRVDLVELGSERRPAAAILGHILARADQRIDVDPGAFAGDETVERRLRALTGHARLYRRDTGIDGLYLGFPFVLARDGKSSLRTRIAPVLLWPVRVNPEVGKRARVSLGFDRDREEVRLNPALEAILGTEEVARWGEAAEEILARSSLTAADVMESFGKLATPRGSTLSALPGRHVEIPESRSELACSAVFFHLAYMGHAIAEDLRQLKGIPPAGTGLETALRVTAHPPASSPPGDVREAERYFTAESDPSQEAAVLEARSAPGLLIEGPPGTGKSQTIVNMVADAIGRGRSLLVVCQKQAALDVVRKRLEAEGLGDRFVMVTDVNRDREPVVRAVREQVESLLSQPAGGVPAWRRERTSLAARIEALEAQLDRHHAALHRVDAQTGLTYRALLGELFALDAEGVRTIEVPQLRPLLATLNPSDVASIEETCGPLVRHWLPSRFEGSPLFALRAFSPDEASLKGLRQAFGAFASAEAARAEIIEETPEAFRIDDPGPYLAWFDQHSETFANLDEPTRADLARWIHLFAPQGEGKDLIAALDALVAEFSDVDPAGYRADLAEALSAMSDDVLAQTTELVEFAIEPVSFLGKLNPGRIAKKRRADQLAESLGVGEDEFGTLLDALALERNMRPLRQRLTKILHYLGGADVGPEPPDELRLLAEALRQALGEVGRLAELIAKFPRPEDMTAVAAEGRADAFDELGERVAQSIERCEVRAESLAALAPLATWFGDAWMGERERAIDRDASEHEAVEALAAALPSVSAYQRFRIAASTLRETEMRFFRMLRSIEDELKSLPADRLEPAIRRILAREARLAWKSRLESEEPALLAESAEIESRIFSFAEADRKMRALNKRLLVEGIDLEAVKPLREWEDATRLRGARARRLREFLDMGADLGLMAVRPVWLMNPDVASRMLPLKAGLFDVVIYDEASQMPVEYALPTLYRGKVVIVSGDEKQMPPTAFFTSRVENDEAASFDGEEPEEDATEEEREAFTETWNRREIKDCPDLLQLARAVLPSTTLKIHYRSAYRELIGFSNASFYSGRLSVPVRHPEAEIVRARPIEVIRVDGVYRDQVNLAEAERIAELLAGIWRAQAAPSIGVVTFNRRQADLIEEVLEDRAEGDADFRNALARERDRIDDGEDMGFFVKNVENVQGDERDVIVFSSTFGRNAQGAFRRHFGVLGQVGGERRLNVAVTRARRRIVMVTSMPVGEISDLLATRRAPAGARDYLQAYLEYARAVSAGEFETARTLLARMAAERAPARDRRAQDTGGFAESVAGFLRDLGHEPVAADDGGAFGLDFAIEDPRTGLYGIGIECDAPRHRILERARAREIWRPRVLSRAIPIVHRVSSSGWYHARLEEQERLRQAIERAVKPAEPEPAEAPVEGERPAPAAHPVPSPGQVDTVQPTSESEPVPATEETEPIPHVEAEPERDPQPGPAAEPEPTAVDIVEDNQPIEPQEKGPPEDQAAPFQEQDSDKRPERSAMAHGNGSMPLSQ